MHCGLLVPPLWSQSLFFPSFVKWVVAMVGCDALRSLLCPCSTLLLKWIVRMVSVWPGGMQAEEGEHKSTKGQSPRTLESDLGSRAQLKTF